MPENWSSAFFCPIDRKVYPVNLYGELKISWIAHIKFFKLIYVFKLINVILSINIMLYQTDI